MNELGLPKGNKSGLTSARMLNPTHHLSTIVLNPDPGIVREVSTGEMRPVGLNNKRRVPKESSANKSHFEAASPVLTTTTSQSRAFFVKRSRKHRSLQETRTVGSLKA
jgi:plastocyanin domain-containing protein